MGKEDAEHALPASVLVALVALPDPLFLRLVTFLDGAPRDERTGLGKALVEDQGAVVVKDLQAAVATVFGLHV